MHQEINLLISIIRLALIVSHNILNTNNRNGRLVNYLHLKCRDVAQFGSALHLGCKGHRFKSCYPEIRRGV